MAKDYRKVYEEIMKAYTMPEDENLQQKVQEMVKDGVPKSMAIYLVNISQKKNTKE